MSTSTTTDLRAQNLWRLLQMADSGHPTGSFAHSGGLEGACEAGLIGSPTEALEFLRLVVAPSILRLDLPLLRGGYEATRRQAWTELWECDSICHALKLPREVRLASCAMGAQRVAIASSIHPGETTRFLARSLEERRWRGHAPVAFGAIGAALAVPLIDTATGYCFQGISGAVSALVKLLRVGQTTAQKWISALADEIACHIEGALAVPIQEAGWFSPSSEIASARHETAYTRLFIS